MMPDTIDNEEITRLLRETEKSLKAFVDDDFLKNNEHLGERFSDQELLEAFRLCLVKPRGKSWSPVWQVLLLLFQSAFSESWTSEPDRFVRVGNYLIHRLPDGARPVVYSFGIGSDITFDKTAADMFGVPIYMYDPTPGVDEFMAAHKDDDRLIFKREGIYSHETTTKLYTSNKVGKLNSSLYPIHGQDGGFELVHCRTLSMFMAENGHDEIDILKMDVEGVADDVLNQVLDETSVRPKQIVAEFEIKGIENPITYLPKISALMHKLKMNDYLIFNQLLTRKASIELIIVHRSLYEEVKPSATDSSRTKNDGESDSPDGPSTTPQHQTRIRRDHRVDTPIEIISCPDDLTELSSPARQRRARDLYELPGVLVLENAVDEAILEGLREGLSNERRKFKDKFNHGLPATETFGRAYDASTARMRDLTTHLFGYKLPDKSNRSYRPMVTENEPLHLDTYAVECGQTPVMAVLNFDVRPRIWHVGPSLKEICREHRSDVEMLLGNLGPGESLNMVLRDAGLRGIGPLRKGAPVHEVEFAPGSVWFANPKALTHQVVYGGGAQFDMWFVREPECGCPKCVVEQTRIVVPQLPPGEMLVALR